MLLGMPLLMAACGPHGDGARRNGTFVGTVVPPFPAELAPAGMQAFPGDSPGYALELVFGTDRQMLWLTRATGGGDPAGSREVVAVLDIPREEQNVSLVYTPGACRVDGVVDPEIIVLARVTFAPRLEEVVLAWRADRGASQFDEVPASAVTCRNPRYPGEARNDS
jgi:hypothetical protein